MIILDLDNCVSDDGWRIPRIDWKRPPHQRYDEYHALGAFDAAANTRLFRIPEKKIIFTGRPETVRVQTMEWLRRNGCEGILYLAMRAPRSAQPSLDLKEAMLLRLFQNVSIGPSDIDCAYDDHPEIVAMYIRHGIRAEVTRIHSIDAYLNPLTDEGRE